MQRINITEIVEDKYGDFHRRVVGWFDHDTAERFEERREVYDGANLAGVHMRDQDSGQTLYRTAGGRWVLMQWSSWQGVVDRWQFIDADEAREWLQINENDDQLERLFGTADEPERGPGRPEIGPVINVRLPQDLLDVLDERAREMLTSRAALIRTMLWQQDYTLRTGKAYTYRVDAGIGTDEEEGI